MAGRAGLSPRPAGHARVMALEYLRRPADVLQECRRGAEQGLAVLINCRATASAGDSQILSEVQQVLERRGALARAPVTLAVSDAVALGIASLFRSPTGAGQVLASFARTGSVDSDALIEAAESERGYASAEGSAALYCLVVWARSKVFQAAKRLSR